MPSHSSNLPSNPPVGPGGVVTGVAPRLETVVPPLCWGAVIAGAVAALALHLLITLFGVGLGLQIVEPATNPEGGEEFSIGVGIAWSLSALLALWVGGWIAGRLTPDANRGLGGLHGFLVWSLATVVTVIGLTTGAGMLAGSVARITGSALGNTAQAVGMVAEGTGNALGEAAEGGGGMVDAFVEELMPDSAPSGQEAAQLSARATREISASLLRFFAQPGDQRAGEAKDVLVRSIARNTPLQEAEIRRKVDEWVASYDRIEEDMKAVASRAEETAREAGETASDYVTTAAVWTFIAFLVGAIAAAWGGTTGARSRRVHDAGAPHAA
jgi:hypothetical protein